MKVKKIKFITMLAALFLLTVAGWAQTTAFNYQGRLTEPGMPPVANYDFDFRLFDVGGVGLAGQQRFNVEVRNGVFNILLDFGANAFPGADRFLEISVRRSGVGGFVRLDPRQAILSAPYSIKSLTRRERNTTRRR